MVIFGYISRNRDDVPLSMMMTTIEVATRRFENGSGGGGGSDEVAAIRLTGAITIIITRSKAKQARKGLIFVV